MLILPLARLGTRTESAVLAQIAIFLKDSPRNGKAKASLEWLCTAALWVVFGARRLARLAPHDMAFIAFILGIVTVLVGALGVVAPSLLAALVGALHGPLGLALAAGLRLLFGGALFVAAPASRAPLAFRALGAAIFAIGLLTPLIGVARFDALLDWWATLDPWIARAWCASAVLVGATIAYGIVPRDAR